MAMSALSVRILAPIPGKSVVGIEVSNKTREKVLIREIIDSGRIGAVNLVTLDTFRTQHARGVAEWLPDWRRIRQYAGGGIAMDHGAHTFYLTFDWLGSHPLSITAKMSSQGAYDTEDNFTCTVTFPTGVAMARLTWNAAVRKVIYTIHGDNGAIRLEDDDVEITERGPSGKAIVERRSIASHWGEALWVSGQQAEARRVWAAALARDPESKPLKATIKRLIPDAQ